MKHSRIPVPKGNEINRNLFSHHYLSWTLLFLAAFMWVPNFTRGQVPSSGPPLAWQTIDWAPTRPDGVTPQSQKNSGEDWWYDFKPVLDANGNQTGYIAAGFTSWKNAKVFDPNSCVSSSSQGDVSCGSFGHPGWWRGNIVQTIAFYNLNGQMAWCKSYSPGEFMGITQSPDLSGFVAIGLARDIKDRTQSLYNWDGPNDGYLGYNPSDAQIDNQQANPYNTLNDCNQWTGASAGAESPAQFVVTKINNEGKAQWSYAYGVADFANYSNPQEIIKLAGKGIDVLGYYGSGARIHYRCVGQSNSDASTGNGELFVLDIFENGAVDWKNNYPSILDIDRTSYALSVNRDNNGVFYVGGSYYNASGGSSGVLMCFTGSNTSPIWHKIINNSYDNNIVAGRYNAAFAVNFDHDNNLLVGMIANSSGQIFLNHNSGSQGNARGWVYTLENDINPANGGIAVRNKVDIGAVSAFDMKIDVTPTSDNGLAVLSTKIAPGDKFTYNSFANDILGVSHLEPPCHTYNGGCDPTNYYYYQWNSNAYVAKYRIVGGQWSKYWDKTVETPGDRGGFPGELKKQECVYTIREADDGGLVVCGNTSHNFDDYYLFKIQNECNLETYGFQYPTQISPNDWYQSGNGYFMNSSQVWNNTNLFVKGIIVIGPGQKLTIKNSTIQFMDGTRSGIETNIVILSGGELEIDNSTLTANPYCDNAMWEGIIVQGYPYSTSASNQGKVVVKNNSIIEHAEVGILAGNFFTGTGPNQASWQGGGIVQVDESTFRNNRRDLIFYPYEASRQYTNATLSHIRNSNFLCTGPLRDEHRYRTVIDCEDYPVGTQTHITLWDIHGIVIQDNLFEGTTNLSDKVWATGIGALNASYRVECLARDANGDCMSSGNTFKKLKRGIESSSTLNLPAPMIEGNTFEDIVVCAVYLKNTSYADVVDNTFDVSYGVDYTVYNNFLQPAVPLTANDGEPSIGLYLENCNRYLVTENSFNASPLGDYEFGAYRGTGMIVYNDNSFINIKSSNLIYNNTFDKCAYGSYGNKLNDGLGATDKGLEFKCNDYYDCGYDILTTLAPGISISQGSNASGTAPAGNRFDGCVLTEAELYNAGNHYKYFHHSPLSAPIDVIPSLNCYDPGLLTGQVQLHNTSISYSKAESCPQKTQRSGRSSFSESKYNQAILDYETALQTFVSIIDDDNTSGLLGIIADDKSDAFIVNTLDPISPYVSDQVLLALISLKPTPMGDVDLVDILVANSPLTSTVLLAAQNRSPALSSKEMDRLNFAQTGTSARFILEAELGYYAKERDFYQSEYTRALIHDYSSATRINDLESHLGSLTGELSQIDMASLYLAKADYTKAQSFTSALRTNPDWTGAADILDHQMAWMMDSINVDTILNDTLLLSAMIDYSNDESLYESKSAAVMLEFLYCLMPESSDDVFEVNETDVPPMPGVLKKQPLNRIEEETSIPSFKAYPNPFNNNLVLQLSEEGVVNIYNASGVLMTSKEIASGQSYTTIDTGNFAKGLYLISFSTSESHTVLKMLKE